VVASTPVKIIGEFRVTTRKRDRTVVFFLPDERDATPHSVRSISAIAACHSASGTRFRAVGGRM
jgi:hypothetical protein